MKTLFFHCCFIVLFVLVVGSQAAAQMKLLMENDQIKIYEVTIKVGVKTLEHNHPADEATYVLSGGKGKVARFQMQLPRSMITRLERSHGEPRRKRTLRRTSETRRSDF